MSLISCRAGVLVRNLGKNGVRLLSQSSFVFGALMGSTKPYRSYRSYRLLKGRGVLQGRGCSWGSLRIPAGRIGEP